MPRSLGTSPADNPRSSLETLLAFAFGVIFCGVLAYAGLRNEPITDPAKFFLLRFLAAISAAGVASVIPGMLDINVGSGKLFAIRGAGALGVFVLVFTVNPPQLLSDATDSDRAVMSANYGTGLYEDAARGAEAILKKNPKDAQANNIKGGVSFYRGDLDGAAVFFVKAHQARPDNTIYTSNLANTLIEKGAYEKAEELLKSIDDGDRDHSYSIGRVRFYLRKFEEARNDLQLVPTNYYHGAARILEAATLKSQAPSLPLEDREVLENKAEQKFKEAFNFDRAYWTGIFSGTQKDIHQGYVGVVDILLPFYRRQILDTSKP